MELVIPESEADWIYKRDRDCIVCKGKGVTISTMFACGPGPEQIRLGHCVRNVSVDWCICVIKNVGHKEG